MAKQVINIGTSANKGDGDPIRTAFDKVNDNFTELYSDVKQLNSVNFGGGTITSDVIGTVSGTDSTMLVDGNNSKVVGPIESNTWILPGAGDIDITATQDDVNISAGGVINLQHVSGQDYVQVSNNGLVMYSDSSIQLKTAGQDIQIGYDTGSGDVQIGHSSSQLFVNGTLSVNEFAKLVPPDYDTAARDGLAGLVDGQIIFNTDSSDLEVYVGGVWKNATTTDVGDLTDNGNIIPTDVSNLTDTTNIIPADVSDLTDTTSIIPNDIGDLVAGGNTGDTLVKTAVGYGFVAPFGGSFADLAATPTTVAGYGITDAVALTTLSVTVASAGTANLTYNDSTGAFTFTPPDLSSYLTSYTETDPVVGAISGIVKADGAGNISAAVAGTDYLTSVAFSDLTSTPTTIAGYGITDAVEDFADLGVTPTTISGYGITDAFDGAFGSLTGTPTTISGYGITDAFDGAFSSLSGTPTTLAGYGITDAVTISGGDISLADDEKIIFGDGDDLQIYHSSNQNIIAGTATTILTGNWLYLRKSGTTENYLVCKGDGAVEVYYDNVKKFATSEAGIQIEQGVEEKFATTNAATGVTALDCATGHVHYLTSPAGDITANFTNLNLTAEYATNLTVIINQGATPYEVTAVQIGGAAQTINWQGGSAPTGNANGIDSFSFTILNDGGTYVVLGQMVDFT